MCHRGRRLGGRASINSERFLKFGGEDQIDTMALRACRDCIDCSLRMVIGVVASSGGWVESQSQNPNDGVIRLSKTGRGGAKRVRCTVFAKIRE